MKSAGCMNTCILLSFLHTACHGNVDNNYGNHCSHAKCIESWFEPSQKIENCGENDGLKNQTRNLCDGK